MAVSTVGHSQTFQSLTAATLKGGPTKCDDQHVLLYSRVGSTGHPLLPETVGACIVATNDFCIQHLGYQLSVGVCKVHVCSLQVSITKALWRLLLYGTVLVLTFDWITTHAHVRE